MKDKIKNKLLLPAVIVGFLLILVLMIVMEVPLFIILFWIFIELRFFTLVSKMFGVIWRLTPVIEIVASIYVAVAILPHRPFDGRMLILNLIAAAVLNYVVLGFELFFYVKNKEPKAGSQAFEKEAVLRELCEYCEKRVKSLIQCKGNVVNGIVLVADSYTGELRVKYLEKNGTYKLDSYIKGKGQLKQLLDTYYYYSVGEKKNGRIKILKDIEKTYESVWLDVLQDCEQRMQESFEIDFKVLIE